MKSTRDHFVSYMQRIEQVSGSLDFDNIEKLRLEISRSLKEQNNLFLCGNGGSAANANHIANDLLYGIRPPETGVRVHSLCSNISVNTCLANDIGYENIFAQQLKTLASGGDHLIVLSGSGNSSNIINALIEAKKIGISSTALLGYDGGLCKDIADNTIHFKIDDMQVCEDFQTIIFHMIIQNIKEQEG